MQPVLLGLALFVFTCQAGWVRNFPCDRQSGLLHAPGAPFWIDSFHGALPISNGPIELSLSILAVHNESSFECDALDLSEFEDRFAFQIAGMPVGRLRHFKSQCPLPMTSALIPPEGLLFSEFELVYSLDRVHRLQTLAAEVSFKHRNGSDAACSWVKITPDIGTSASVALTFIPAIGAVLVGIASYLKRARNMDSIPRTPFEWISQGPIWDIILDLAKYLGYLQFIFLTGSLTMEYPGFYQPIVSQLSWASLLYWPGPINHGFTWTGIEDGIYVSNSSYGLEYMAQMMGYPAMPDIMLNSSINFVLLIAALCLLCLLVLAASPSTEKDLASLQSAGLAILGAVLSCFTLPVFSYMSYEFILIGYLPNYRVTLVGLAMTFLVYLNYAVTSHFEARRALDLTDASSYHARKSQSSLLGKIARTLSQWLPHAIALVEGIVIGGLQNWALAQVLVIAGCEAIVLVSTIIRRHTRLLWSRSFWCVIVRLLTVILCVTFVQPSSEAARQWIGYLILCLHAVVVVFGYLVASLWECSRALFRIIKSKRRDTSSGNMELPLQDMPPRFHLPTNEKAPHVWQRPSLESLPQAMRPGSSSTSHHPDFSDSDNRITPFLPTPTGIRHYVTDFSGFYRPPKSLSSRPPPSESVRTSSGAESAPASASASTAGSGSGSSSTSRNAPNHDSLDELLEPWVRPDVDYSTREVDLYYGRNRFSSETESSRAPVLTNTGAEAQENLFTRLTRGAGRLKPKKKEKGFQVARPPRPL